MKNIFITIIASVASNSRNFTATFALHGVRFVSIMVDMSRDKVIILFTWMMNITVYTITTTIFNTELATRTKQVLLIIIAMSKHDLHQMVQYL